MTPLPLKLSSFKDALAFRQLAYILLFSSLVTLILASIQIFMEYRSDLDDVRLQLDQIGKGYLESLSSSLWKLDDDQIRVQLNDALSHRDIVYLEIREDSDLLFTAGKRPDSEAVIVKQFKMVHEHRGDAKELGTLEAVASLKGTYDRMLKRIVFIFTTQGIKTFLVSFFILFIIYRLVVRHLIDLSRYSREMSLDDTRPENFILNRSRRKSAGPDELDELVHAINTMRSRLISDIQAIREKETRYRQTIESSMDGFWMTDSRGRILEVNNAYTDLVGFSRSRLLSMSPDALGEIVGAAQTFEYLEGIRKKGQGRFETRHTTRSGDRVDLEISAAYSPDNRGTFFLFLRNITSRKQQEQERKRLELQLRQSQKMESLGTLAGGIAHDFNNILVPILGNTEILLEDLPEDSGLRTCLKEIHASTMRARALVKQILTFSRQGGHDIRTIRIQPILKESLKLLRATIPSSIAMQADVREECPEVDADPTHIHQIIMNLVTNAFHAMEDGGGHLDVSLIPVVLNGAGNVDPKMPAGDYARLTVKDTGTGMSPSVVENIFDPFYTTKSPQKGTGLGLSMVHGIVTHYGGAIQVDSRPGEGSRFDIYLPAAGGSEAVSKPEDRPAEMPGGQERILVVDDEAAVLAVEAKMLTRLGYSVTPAESGASALDLLKESPRDFDLVMTDYTMPGMAGDFLATAVKKIRSDLPVIVCTGYSDRATHLEKNREIQALIFKPLVMADLARCIRTVLDRETAPGPL